MGKQPKRTQLTSQIVGRSRVGGCRGEAQQTRNASDDRQEESLGHCDQKLMQENDERTGRRSLEDFKTQGGYSHLLGVSPDKRTGRQTAPGDFLFASVGRVRHVTVMHRSVSAAPNPASTPAVSDHVRRKFLFEDGAMKLNLVHACKRCRCMQSKSHILITSQSPNEIC